MLTHLRARWLRPAASLALVAMVGMTVAAGCGGDDDENTAGASETKRGKEAPAGRIRFAVTDLQGLEELQREFGAFVDTLEDLSGLEVDFFAVTDRAAAAAALDAERVDLVFTGPAEYVVMAARTDAVPVVAIRRPDYHSCIYARAGSGIEKLSDLAGRKVGMSDIGSTSGHLGPSQLLLDAGLDPQEDVEVLTLGDAVHEALRRDDVDAVGIGCHDYAEFMAEEDNPEMYPLLEEGPPLPPDVILARPELDEAVVDAVKTSHAPCCQGPVNSSF